MLYWRLSAIVDQRFYHACLLTSSGILPLISGYWMAQLHLVSVFIVVIGVLSCIFGVDNDSCVVCCIYFIDCGSISSTV